MKFLRNASSLTGLRYGRVLTDGEQFVHRGVLIQEAEHQTVKLYIWLETIGIGFQHTASESVHARSSKVLPRSTVWRLGHVCITATTDGLNVAYFESSIIYCTIRVLQDIYCYLI